MDALRDAQSEAEVATRTDLAALRQEIHEWRLEILGELRLTRWMLGLLLAGVASLVLRAFF